VKAWFGACAVIAGSICFVQMIVPLKKAGDEINRQTDEARAKIEEVRSKIDSLRLLENEATAAVEELEEIDQRLPATSPLVWIPDRLTKHFQQFKFAAPLVRLASAQAEPEMRGFQRIYWSVGLPLASAKRPLDKALFAAAELERNDPFFRVVDLSILPNLEQPGERIAVVAVVTIVKN